MDANKHETDVVNTTETEVIPPYLQGGKLCVRDFMEHLPGPFAALVLHLIAILLLFNVVIGEPPEKPDVRQEVTIIEQPDNEIEPEEIIHELEPVDDVPPIEEIYTNLPEPTIKAPETINIKPMSDVASTEKLPDVDIKPIEIVRVTPTGNPQGPGWRPIPGPHGPGTTPRGPKPPDSTEAAIMRGLRWLRDTQNADGSWGDPGTNQPALTAVAIMAFLGHGETPAQSIEFPDTVRKGLLKLIDYVNTMPNPKGCISNGGNGYAHAMVAYAIADAYAMTQIPDLEIAMNKIIYSIVQGQNAQGGYDYSLKISDRNDLSIGGWNYQALKGAYSAGSTVEGLREAIEKGSKSIRTLSATTDGGFSYTPKSNATLAMTSVGTLCLQLFGDGKSSEAARGYQWIKSKNAIASDYRDYKNAGAMPLYTWYYMTQTIFQATGGSQKNPDWNNFQRNFLQVSLVREQDRKGFWDAPNVKYGNSDSSKEGNHSLGTELGQRVWSTSMCILMLEVYYRFVPSTTLDAQKQTIAKNDDDDELSI